MPLYAVRCKTRFPRHLREGGFPNEIEPVDMLNALRNSAGRWAVRLLLGILIISFSLWGIEGVFRGGFDRSVAEVGGREITVDKYDRAYRDQVAMLSNRLGRQLSQQEARMFGVGQNVLQNLIQTTALDIHASSLGLGISESAIIDAVHSERAFQGADEKFEKARFDEIVRNMGLNEQGFIARQREDMVRQQVVGAMSDAVSVPKTMLDAMNHFRNDERVLKYFIVEPKAAGEIAAPDDATLQKYFDDNKSRYKAPEYRRIGVLLLTPDAIKDTIALTDDELKAHYEATKRVYSQPERRTIQRLVFKDMAAARDAAAKLAADPDFIKFGKEIGQKEDDVNLGTFARDKVADKAIGEAAFKLEKDKVSEPISGFMPVIIKVTEILPGEEKSFDQVKEQVRTALGAEKGRAEIQKLYDAVEDTRGGGSSVAEAAKKLNLPFKEITVDRRGMGKDGKPVDGLPAVRALLANAFESDVGVETNAATLEDGYAFFEVLEITPERQKSFDEVKAEVTTAWTDDETRKRLRAKAEELVGKAKGAAGFDAAAAEIGAKVETTAPLKREATAKDLPRTAVSLGFTLPDQGIGNAQLDGKPGQAVFQVAELKKAPDLDEKQAETLRTELRQGMGVDILTQYISGLQTDYGVHVNNRAVSQLFGQQ
jgi:peptidyl-prolyl cis-trans isomerase D